MKKLIEEEIVRAGAVKERSKIEEETTKRTCRRGSSEMPLPDTCELVEPKKGVWQQDNNKELDELRQIFEPHARESMAY